MYICPGLPGILWSKTNGLPDKLFIVGVSEVSIRKVSPFCVMSPPIVALLSIISSPNEPVDCAEPLTEP